MTPHSIILTTQHIYRLCTFHTIHSVGSISCGTSSRNSKSSPITAHRLFSSSITCCRSQSYSLRKQPKTSCRTCVGRVSIVFVVYISLCSLVGVVIQLLPERAQLTPLRLTRLGRFQHVLTEGEREHLPFRIVCHRPARSEEHRGSSSVLLSHVRYAWVGEVVDGSLHPVRWLGSIGLLHLIAEVRVVVRVALVHLNRI